VPQNQLHRMTHHQHLWQLKLPLQSTYTSHGIYQDKPLIILHLSHWIRSYLPPVEPKLDNSSRACCGIDQMKQETMKLALVPMKTVRSTPYFNLHKIPIKTQAVGYTRHVSLRQVTNEPLTII
jgi:hypothetical protein